MVSVGKGRIDVGIEGAGGRIRVAFDTRNLYQSAYWVAGHAQVMFQSHFCCIFNLCRAAAKQLAGSG